MPAGQTSPLKAGADDIASRIHTPQRLLSVFDRLTLRAGIVIILAACVRKAVQIDSSPPFDTTEHRLGSLCQAGFKAQADK
jgi:hypothetical protein